MEIAKNTEIPSRVDDFVVNLVLLVHFDHLSQADALKYSRYVLSYRVKIMIFIEILGFFF